MPLPPLKATLASKLQHVNVRARRRRVMVAPRQQRGGEVVIKDGGIKGGR